ncbi:MAG: RNA polymerase sigma factor [Myxococcota bacterium]|nr:RNA polymerase sigma factor [Myxococcota bacterium]
MRAENLALARRAAAGDRDAQRDVFLAQRKAVHHTLYRILGSNRELEDLVQDAFFEIFRALPSFRGDSTLTRWCQTIATRIAYLAISRKKPVAIDLALVEDTLANDSDTRRESQIREAARRLYAALDRLDPKQRIAFALATIDGLSMAEVAALTESSIVAVKTRVWRARKDLMKRAAKDEVLRSYIGELDGGAS